MGIVNWIKRQLGRSPRPIVRREQHRTRRIRGGYDAAKTTSENENHWAAAGAGSANAEHTPGVRAILRNRAREECRNNGYAKGLVRTIRNDVVGTGPRLQIAIPETYTDPDFGVSMRVPSGMGRAVELQWVAWCDQIGFADKLRIMEESYLRDGECFGLMFTNWARPDDVIQLDLRLIEADQVSTPDLLWNDPLAIDGIRFDEFGNPTEYHVLRHHPGDTGLLANSWDYDRIRARHIFHWFDPDRPNQARGVPPITPSIPLYAVMRRYTAAVVGAAETAASIAGVMETDIPDDPNTPNAPTFDTMDEVDVPRRGLLTLPYGYKAHSFESSQPTSTYREFKGEILTETGRPLCAPRNVSTASSAEYNYSSARLDHLPYRQSIKIDRERMRRVVLDRLFRAWLRVAQLVPGHLPAGLPPVACWTWSWHWDGFTSIDPVKDATADDMGLKNGTRTLAQIAAESGTDWEEQMRQRAKEISLARKLEAENGLPAGTLYPLVSTEPPPAPVEEPANASATAAV